MSNPTSPPVRRIERIRHELQLRDLEVSHVQQLSPHFLAITLHGESLASFRSDSFDDHVKVFFGNASGEPARRDYTPRRFDLDRLELTLEFALHGSGAASDWARQAAVGQRLAVAGPRGSMVIPNDYDWHLLIGDTTALPAVHRRLEELPPEARVIAVLQVNDPTDRRPIARRERTTLHWVDSVAGLQATVAGLALPEGEGFAWAAGEASAMAAVRALLVAKGQPKEALKVAAYWKAGAQAFHETLEA
jgi:NADPH-dependent ferric siderophore reductase